MDDILNLGYIQFYWRVTKEPNIPPNPVPDYLPFKLSFDKDKQLFIQLTDKRVLDCLELVYRQGNSIGYLQEGHSLAGGYSADFMRFICKYMQPVSPRGNSKVTEIGCGDGYLLQELKRLGYDVLGIEPSYSSVSEKKQDISIINDFYPNSRPPHKSDYIIHYDVLEHIPNPESFIAEHGKDLHEDGKIIIAVPDCGPFLAMGDISPLVHEHFNYFDETSLQLTVEKAGFDVIAIEKSGHGGVLYCVACFSNGKGRKNTANTDDKFRDFVTKQAIIRNNFISYINLLRERKQSFGFYVPLRAVPYLSIMEFHSGYRFFDDNTGWHNNYFDGFGPRIENMSDLVNDPVQNIIIMSITFADTIAGKIKNKVRVPINIRTLADFCAKSHSDAGDL